MKLVLLWCHFMAALKIALYKLIYGKKISFGTGTTFRRNFRVIIGKEGKIAIGDHCFFNNACSLNCFSSITIGDGTIFGEGVKVYDHNHKFADPSKSIKEQGYSIGAVSIGTHCWIGSNVVLLKGAEIGDHCVIGAGCVVEDKVESGSIVKLSASYSVEKITGGTNCE